MRKSLVYLLAFTGGLVTLGAELSASRLLAPYFGTSLVVWSGLIGLILLCLALGYWMGGAWIDRRPVCGSLFAVVWWGGLALALVPFAARPVLLASVAAASTLSLGLFFSSLGGVLVLMGLPMVILGCISPMAIRLAAAPVEHAGRMAGRIFAFSTAGSFFGSIVPALVLIPSLGTRRTFLVFALVLLSSGLLAALFSKAWKWCLTFAAGVLVVAGLFFAAGTATLRPGQSLVLERESSYQYIRVTEDAVGWRYLLLNEGIVTHSKYHPVVYFSNGEWDLMALAPFFNPPEFVPAIDQTRWAFVGGGAGTCARLVTETFGPVPIDNVEIDPVVSEIGRGLFGMTQQNVRVIAMDGRAWVRSETNIYDVISVDAYQQPYIPFELTTAEFFREARARLSDSGVLALNCGRTPEDTRIVDALCATMAPFFGSVWIIDLPHLRNSVIYASVRRIEKRDAVESMSGLKQPALSMIASVGAPRIRRPGPGPEIFTDDRAPIERYVHRMIAGEIARMARGR